MINIKDSWLYNKDIFINCLVSKRDNKVAPRDRLTKAYDVTIQNTVNHTQKWRSVKTYFAVYSFNISCEMSKVPFEISHTILSPYMAKHAFHDVLEVWRIMIS